ncbi:MAG: hypothetical protein WCK00_12090, partial [Deltaproteobacteria bacterium]
MQLAKIGSVRQLMTALAVVSMLFIAGKASGQQNIAGGNAHGYTSSTAIGNGADTWNTYALAVG